MATMEDPSDLESILAACGVEPTISSAIIAEGWTKDMFAMCATSLVDLDAHIHELQPADHEFSFREKACLRMAWKKCQETPGPIEPAGDTPAPPASSASGGWTETFAPKLSSTTIAALKKQFLLNYPSEVLTPETHARDIQWDNRSEVIPIKGLIDPPKSSQDGGGVHSIPDWSTPHTKPDIFRQIRRPWMQHIMNNLWTTSLNLMDTAWIGVFHQTNQSTCTH